MELFSDIIKALKSALIDSDPDTKLAKYRIVDILNAADLSIPHTLVVQLVGTRHILKLELKSIINDAEILQAFSPLDVKTITLLSIQVDIPFRFKLLSEQYTDERRKFSFIDNISKDEFSLVLDDIIENNEFLQQMDPRDAFKIGYITGNEEFVKSLQAINLSKVAYKEEVEV